MLISKWPGMCGWMIACPTWKMKLQRVIMDFKYAFHGFLCQENPNALMGEHKRDESLAKDE